MNASDREKKIHNLLPRENGYRKYDKETVKNCKEIIKLIKDEPNKQLQLKYFKELIDRLFMQSPGFLIGVMSKHHEEMLNEQKKEICSMLRELKRLHFNIDYTPGCMKKINAMIVNFGGTVMSVEQMRQQKREKFERAIESLRNGGKMPRKQKKIVTRYLKQR